MKDRATLYLHYPCFDGVISSVLVSDYLESVGWQFERYEPVGYWLKSDWQLKELDRPCAVVDFLYHPDAQFWADHHATTFIDEGGYENFKRHKTPWLIYDNRAGSCATLIWRNFVDYFQSKHTHYQELVAWAEKIDAATYDSVKEAIFGSAPALRISFSLIKGNSIDYCKFLIGSLRQESMEKVASHPNVESRYVEVRSAIANGLDRFGRSARLSDDNIVVFDIAVAEDDIISRYAPFYFFPDARYSIGLLRFQDSVKITAMRNPWKDFPSVPLGRLFGRFGGGGHERVGAVILGPDRVPDSEAILGQLAADIRQTDKAMRIEAESSLA